MTAVNERKEPATASVSATLSDCSGAQHGNVSKLSGTTALNSSSIPSRVSVKKPSGSSAVRPAASNQRTGPLSFLQPSFIPASTPKVSPELDPLLPSSCPPLSLPCSPLPSPFSSLSSSCPPLLPLPTRPTTATQVIDTSDAVTTAALDQVLKAETAAADNHPFATGVEIPDDDNAQISDSVATPEPCLPGFQPMSATSNFKWGEVDGDVFCSNINSAYAEIVHWRRNLFLVPSGKAGKEFILELTRLWRAYASASAMEAIALRAAMVMCALVLQKPHSKSKSRDHVSCVERRLKLWSKGDIEDLLIEGRTIQGYLRRGKRHKSQEDITRTFTKLMLLGNVKSAMRVIADSSTGGVLNLDAKVSENKTVHEVLKEKHPEGMDAIEDALLATTARLQPPHPVLFDRLTGESIKYAALRTFGSSGPSGVDAAGWRRMCVSFHGASKSLCDALAAVARRIATTYVDPEGLAAFTACRLCPLDKCPGVRPIGISEAPRRVIGKAIMAVIGDDVRNSAGSLQLSAGQPCGCEAAIHAMKELFSDDDCEGVLLVDANNAFNSLNRSVALRNVGVLCPALGPVVVNTYRSSVDLFVGGETILSTEGTTQGDPLAMAIYAVAVTPLIHRVQEENVKQIWFADDASGGGKLLKLKVWLDNLRKYGPMYGYFVNLSKTWLVVKEDHFTEAEDIFRDTGVNITKEGKRHLGGALGTNDFVSQYVSQQVLQWVTQIDRLASIAKTQPQIAYTAFRHGLSNRWSFMARTVEGIGDLFMPLEEAIRQRFIPALTGREIPGDLERDLFALPTRLGGLGLSDPTKIVTNCYQASKTVTAPLVALIVQQKEELGDVCRELVVRRNIIKSERRKEQAIAAEHLRERLTPKLQRCMELAKEKGTSSWLEALPVREHEFNLSKSEFRDGLCLRYGWVPARLPETCVCGKAFDTAHALSCPTGGLPSIRHNELRDLLALSLSDVCSDVVTEPHLNSAYESQPQSTQSENNREQVAAEEDVRLDIRARGFWGGPMQVALFDVRVFNPFAASAITTPLVQLYRRHEAEKRRKYEARVLAEHCSFTPLIFSTSGGCSVLTSKFLKALATKLAAKKHSTYSQALCWLRTRISFSLLRSAVMCLRGCRQRLVKTVVEPVAALSAAGLL